MASNSSVFDSSAVSGTPATGRSFGDSLGSHPKILWVVSAGGHLAQAHRIEGLIGRNPDSLWVTSDVPQSQSLLAGRRTHFVDYVASRDLVGAIRASSQTSRLAASEKFDFCVSTGAALAVAALPRVALQGVPSVYIESIARSTGPSLTGKLMRYAPRVRTMTQHESWANRTWEYAGSILDDVMPTKREVAQRGRRKVFVTLGTIRPYRFDRAVDAVLACLKPDDDVSWQLGITTRDDLPGEVFSEISGAEMKDRFAKADLVIAHAGVGSILMSLEAGKAPVLAVRQGAHREHVDDHQQGIAELMASRGLAFPLDLDNPEANIFDVAASTKVVSTDA